MKYIIVDFEWNQPLSEAEEITQPFCFDSEIIEIGAIRLDENFAYEDEFKAYVKPVFFPYMKARVAGLTKIRMQELEHAPRFPEAYAAFAAWCGDEYCLCTWGERDVPTLMDNMLMHGMETPARLLCCDMQEIFGSETMRERRRWSLEDAIKLLGLAKDRAHDALNDVRNTCRVCERVDIFPFVDTYLTAFVNYPQDRLSGLITGRSCHSLEEAQQDRELTSLTCPYCGEEILLGDWIRESDRTFVSCGCCGEGDEFLVRFQQKRRKDTGGLHISRSAYEMTDLLWERYQDVLEQEETGSRPNGADPLCYCSANW